MADKTQTLEQRVTITNNNLAQIRADKSKLMTKGIGTHLDRHRLDMLRKLESQLMFHLEQLQEQQNMPASGTYLQQQAPLLLCYAVLVVCRPHVAAVM